MRLRRLVAIVVRSRSARAFGACAVHGRAGVRAGETGLVYGKVGYRWVNFDRYGNNSPDFGRISYGVGGEFGPKAIGLDGLVKKEGVRFRAEVATTGNFETVRPSLGIIGHF